MSCKLIQETTAMLGIKNLTVTCGRAVGLSDVSIQLECQELMALSGSNGYGKSTFFKFIPSTKPPAKVRLLFNDEGIQQLPFHKTAQKGIALVPERRTLCPDLVSEKTIEALNGKAGTRMVGG
jgi:ABC-type branched-subunit amino acid transport system ATPase component